MATYRGGCHCGDLTVAYETELYPAGQVPRACTCGFCRKHATEALSDPAGRLTFSAAHPDRLNRYTFGLGITEFLICRTCGVYVGAIMPDGDTAYANVMRGVLDARDLFTSAPVPVGRSDENEDEKRARRRAMWTPATLEIGDHGRPE
jgi:hypothetical protein